MIEEIIGFMAGILTSINMIPQIIQSIKTKKVEDVSLWMFVIYDAGLVLWVTYGVMIKSYPIIIMDGAACLCSLLMTYIKIRYNKK